MRKATAECPDCGKPMLRKQAPCSACTDERLAVLNDACFGTYAMDDCDGECEYIPECEAQTQARAAIAAHVAKAKEKS
jgi:hypothetical protein